MSQGSVIGLLLFLLFINGFPSVSKFLTFYLFVDDTNIHYESPDLLDIQNIVDREFRKVRKWLVANRLAPNIKKTNFVIFRSQQRIITDRIALKIEKRSSNKSLVSTSWVCC